MVLLDLHMGLSRSSELVLFLQSRRKQKKNQYDPKKIPHRCEIKRKMVPVEVSTPVIGGITMPGFAQGQGQFLSAEV